MNHCAFCEHKDKCEDSSHKQWCGDYIKKYSESVNNKLSIEEKIEWIKNRQPELHKRTMKFIKELNEAYEATKNSKLHFP